MPSLLRRAGLLAGALLLHSAAQLHAQSFDPRLYQDMRWRMIGPHRGGRGKAAVGVPDLPNVFYIGFHNGGVWKTTDYGRTWTPIFDDQPTGSIGAIAVAPSNPDVIYVGSGEGNQRPDLATGDGIYRSNDGGRTWTHYGLRDAQQIPQIIVDPRNPDRLFVAALGHPYGPNEERGVFRSTDGGRSFEKVLYKDENTGAAEVAFDPKNPDVVYAALWESRQAPWENGVFTGPGSGLYKSTDGGTNWKPIGAGLPSGADGLGRIGLGMCDVEPSRIYAVVASPSKLGGIYRSDDGGENWRRVNDDNRLWGREGDFHEIKTDPKNCDVLSVANVASWKSTDGGKTFGDLRGAPGGDDYQRIWINPKNTDIMLIIADQGAVITVNGGETWSSWYNQPTAQFYHVSTDNAFPYRVCGGQQESGSACVSSRGNDGQITFREWHPVGVEEYGYVAADPLDPDIVYGGKITRFDRRTGQVQNISPRPGASGAGSDVPYRVVRTMPVLFSPIDPKTLYFSSNVVWKTTTGGKSWTAISPDLTRKTWEVPPNVGKYDGSEAAKPSQRGVVYTIAPSPLDINRIWAGTDDGLIHVTADGGKTWNDVTPPEVKPWAKISLIDASHFDPRTAYAAVNTFRLDDLRPHIYRTRDAGKTWTHITAGIPDGGIVNTVREDPKRRSLLFAGTEQTVYVSFDDGDRWESLRLNLPATSIRDLVIKDDDLVVGTHGRSFWILDDIAPLRELSEARGQTTGARGQGPGAGPFLFTPAHAWRVRWNMNTDTPLPPDEATAPNPPEGAIINYYLKSAASGPVTLEITGADGKLVRRYSSTDEVFEPDPATINIPLYWFRPLTALSAAAGMHRFTWDMHYQPLDPSTGSARAVQIGGPNLPIAAIGYNTVPAPTTPWVNPGQFTVKLTVNGKTYSQPITVKQDPRVKTPAAAMQQVYTLSKATYYAALDAQNAAKQAQAVRDQIAKLRPQVNGAAADALTAFDRKIAPLAPPIEANAGGRGGGDASTGSGQAGSGRGNAPAAPPDSLAGVSAGLAGVMNLLQGADVRPTTVQLQAIAAARAAASTAMTRWNAVNTVDIPALNATLKAAGLPPVTPQNP
jgi:photosystem II stability/assembly factor-like uncharacterized protein